MKILLLAVALLACARSSFACSCFPQPALKISLEKTIEYEKARAVQMGRPFALVVVEGEVESKRSEPRNMYPDDKMVQPIMRLKVTRTIHGGEAAVSLDGESLDIIGQDGLNCNQGLSVFEIGKSYAVAVFPAYKSAKYGISGCGVYYQALP